jgi:hypothetical protein
MPVIFQNKKIAMECIQICYRNKIGYTMFCTEVLVRSEALTAVDIKIVSSGM